MTRRPRQRSEKRAEWRWASASYVSRLTRVLRSVLISISICAMHSFEIIRIHVESIQDKTLSLPDRHSPAILSRKFPFGNIRSHNITGLIAPETLAMASVTDRKSIFVRRAHLPRTVAGRFDYQQLNTFDIDRFWRACADTGSINPVLFR